MTSQFPIRLVALLFVVCASTSIRAEQPWFPPASPESQGVSPEALKLLGKHVQSFVDRKAVVGAELHVIQNRRTVYHEAFGWADEEEARPLKTDSVYCVRSMTKPVLGTAIQMLLDEGKLKLETPVAEIVPSFNRPELREITVEHLLTHTSGLPLTAIRRPLKEYSSLAQVAEDAAEAGISFTPGSDFQYSDAGSDTLGAAIHEITGLTADKFIQERILQKLKLQNSLTSIQGEPKQLARIPSAYSGGDGKWRRHWSPSEPPIFPIFLTSQSLYSTTADYARFLTCWMDGGEVDGQSLFSKSALQRGLTAHHSMKEYPTGFQGLRVFYGQQWMVFTEKDGTTPVIFGHNGSDGTYAWAWPERDLIVLYFTQSRGTTTGLQLESVLDALLVRGDTAGYLEELQAQAAAESSLDQFVGIYWDQDKNHDYYEVLVEDDQLLVERPGRFRMPATPAKEPNRFKIAGGVITLDFQREGKSPPSAMVMTSRGKSETQRRHEPQQDLPRTEELLKQVAEAHGIEQLASLGIVKLEGTINMGLLGGTGKLRLWFDETSSRTEVDVRGTTTTIITDGKTASMSAGGAPFTPMTGALGTQEVLAHPAIQYGGWPTAYQELNVLKVIEESSSRLTLVRARSAAAPGATFIVDEEGRLFGERRVQYIPGGGFVGLETKYSDYRNVEGIQLPFSIHSKYAHPLLGKISIQFEKFETGVTASDLFEVDTTQN